MNEKAELIKVNTATLGEEVERVLMKGDLSTLNEEKRLAYYNAVCESLGLNKLTRPFDYLTLNNKLTLYATKSCTDQLRFIHKISIEIVSRDKIGDVYVVAARARNAEGRMDESTGAVALGKAFGDNLANLYMKAETKAKRRVTLSICGLGLLDESEVDSITPTVGVGSEQVPVAKLPDILSPQEPCSPSAEVVSDAPGERVIEYGKKYKGMRFKELEPYRLQTFIDWMKREHKDERDDGKKFIEEAEEYIGWRLNSEARQQEQQEIKAKEEMLEVPF